MLTATRTVGLHHVRDALRKRNPRLLARVRHLRTGAALVAMTEAYRVPHHRAGESLHDICHCLLTAIERTAP